MKNIGHGDFMPNARFAMLQLGVHCASIICTNTCYGIGTNTSDFDCQHGISYHPIYHSRLGVSVWIVSAEFISSCFC